MNKPNPYSSPERITLRSILNQLMLHLNLEKGMLYSLWVLLVSPGKTIHEYLFVDRKRLIKPLGFVFLFAGLSTYLMVNALSGDFIKRMESVMQRDLNEDLSLNLEKEMALDVNQFVIQYRTAIQLSGIPLLALLSFLFYRQQKLNYAEHLILGCYVIGYISWIGVLGALSFFLWGNILILIVISVLSVLYQIYFYWQVFRKTSYAFLKAVLLNMAYFSTFALILLSLLTLTLSIVK